MINSAGTVAPITEIFSSLQGEGPYLGIPQIFVRFRDCNLKCDYCDEAQPNGRASFKRFNPQRLAEKILKLNQDKGPHHSVSLTGVEPLLYWEFLRSFLPRLKRNGFRIYLESNGTLDQTLGRVIRYCDIVAMDIKLPSATGQKSLFENHERFLKIASRKEVFVKAVVSNATMLKEIRRCVRMIEKVDRRIVFVLQPKTVAARPDRRAFTRALRDFYPIAQLRLENVRVIAQMHKIWGVR